MDEQTTTEVSVESGGQVIGGVAVDDQGMALPEPEASESTEADVTTVPSQEPAEAPAEAPETTEPVKADNSTVEWLKNKGIDPSSPEAIEKVAEMARNAEKAMHQKATKASELEKVIDDGILQEAVDTGFSDDDRLKLARLDAKLTVREFFEQNPVAKPFEQAMITELSNKPHLAGDLESLYALAAVKSGTLEDVKSQGGRDALVSLAQKQQAAVPRGNAVTPNTTGVEQITSQNVDRLVQQNNQAWFEKNYDAINKAMAG